MKEGVGEGTHTHAGESWLPALTWPRLQVRQQEQYPWLDAHSTQDRVRKEAEVEVLHDLVKSPQLVTEVAGTNRQHYPFS